MLFKSICSFATKITWSGAKAHHNINAIPLA